MRSSSRALDPPGAVRGGKKCANCSLSRAGRRRSRTLAEERSMIKSCVALAAVLCVTVATPARSHGQVFLASRPHPDFLVGPLFVVANVSPGPGPVTVNL